MKEKQILKLLGDNVKKFRKKCSYSQEDLAVKTGLHRTYIGGIERGERNVSLLNIEKVAKALDVQVSDLLN